MDSTEQPQLVKDRREVIWGQTRPIRIETIVDARRADLYNTAAEILSGGSGLKYPCELINAGEVFWMPSKGERLIVPPGFKGVVVVSKESNPEGTGMEPFWEVIGAARYSGEGELSEEQLAAMRQTAQQVRERMGLPPVKSETPTPPVVSAAV